MTFEKSCGAVIYKREKDAEKEKEETLFLIIQHKYGRHWAYPKGHMEEGETERETAKREVEEETGLHISFHPDFRYTSYYRPRKEAKKEVVYFLAQFESGTVVLQESEVCGYTWLPFNHAHKLLTFPIDKKILREANKLLEKTYEKTKPEREKRPLKLFDKKK